MMAALDVACRAFPSAHRTILRSLLLVCGVGLLLLAAQAAGQMARDGSLGQTPGALSGPHYTIDVQNAAEQIRGNNLFHSFSEFNVNTGQTATFTGPNNIANIINRVTGQNLSNIDGAVNSRAAMPAANLFLINPNGLVLGPNASFNVGGSIHLSTADYVRMGDGAQFFANLTKQSTLTSAPVTAFGFLGERAAAPLTVQAGAPIGVEEGKSLSLVGGDVSISGRAMTAPGGQIIVASVMGVGEQTVGTGPLGGGGASGVSPSAAHGTIQLTSGATLQTSSQTGPAGSIFIVGGKFVMDHARLEANSEGAMPTSSVSGAADHAHISVHADDVALSNGTSITASTASEARAGDISMEVRTLRSNADMAGVPITGVEPVIIASSSMGQGGAGTITISGREGKAAQHISLSNTEIVASVTDAAIPTIAPALIGEQVETAFPKYSRPVPPPTINIAAEHVTLANGTTIKADTTGGADAGAITVSVDTLQTRAGPDGRVLISSTSNCGQGCLGGQAGDITIQGLQDADHAVTRKYAFSITPDITDSEVYVFHLADNMDIRGTDIYSKALGNAPGGKVLLRAQEAVSLTDSNLSVETQDFNLDGLKPNGEPARYQGLSQIDIMASDIVMRDTTIKADALVSDIGSCPLCQGGPTAGEIWLRAGTSVTAENTSITNTSRGRAQAGITKIIKDNHYSEGAIWDSLYPDTPTQMVKLSNSEVTVEAQHEGLPGYLRIRADEIILDHTIVNSQVNNVTNVLNKQGQLLDVEGAGEAGLVLTDGRTVQGILLLSAKSLDITGGGIIAPTQGNRIANRIELYTDELTTRPGTRPGGTFAEPRILNETDPTRVVISSGSTGRGGAGLISIAGQRPPSRGDVPGPPASSIRLTGTDVLTDTRNVGRGGKIELRSSGPVELNDASIFARSGTSDGGTVDVVSSGPIEMDGSHLGTSSTGGLGGSITVKGSDINLTNASSITAESHGAKNAGKIELVSGNNILMTDSSVSTEALKASGGDIKLTAPNTVTLRDSVLTASVAGGNETTGGKIDIDPQYVVIQNSNIFARAADGNGGRIAIEASQAVLVDPNSTIDATSSRGVSGQILIQSPIQQLAGAIAPLPQAFAVAANLYGQRCAAQKGGQFSSFVQGARDGVPPQPGDLLPSPLIFASEMAPAQLGSQVLPNLTAARLGLPEFEQLSQVFSAGSAGCRS